MLSGDLTDFSLPDVLRLLSTARKSGVLTLHEPHHDAGVFVRNGAICLALIDVTRVPFGPRMIMKNIADRKTIAATSRTGSRTVFDLACALMRGVPDAEAASGLATDHTLETVGWLSQFSAAMFDFDPTVAVDAWPFEPLATERVVADIERGAPQWAELEGVVDDLSLMPSCVPEPPDAATLELTGRQWRIVALVDGQRTIKDLVEAVGLGVLETGRELAGLVSEGLVELVGPGGRSAVDVLLQDVQTFDGFATSPEWLAYDHVPAQRVPGEPAGGVHSVAGDAVVVTEDPATQPVQPHQEPVVPSGERDDPVDAGEAAPTPADVASDANLGLLNRLIGPGRSI